MASNPNTNSRAALLSGLRTGGVRSVSGPVPHTAAPAGTFNIPRYSPPMHSGAFPEEEDELADMVSPNMYIHNNANANYMQQHPMTAAVDGASNRFAQQQGMGMSVGGYMDPQAQMQALQLQMMQMEIARLQAQQYQTELLAQAQRQQRQVPQRRATSGFVPPATAGPTTTSFDLRANAANAQARRVNQADQLRAMLGVGNDEQMPMTAALGGRFGGRMPTGQFDEDMSAYLKTPATPNFSNTISGGTALGHANGISSPNPSKSDAAVSWRRSGNNSVLSGNRSVSSPLVKITPPPIERTSPVERISPVSSPARTRPPALQFTPATSQPINAVAVDTDGADGDDNSSVSSKSGSAPSTPRTSSSLGDAPPLSPREEASKKLYEGLGLGKGPAIAVSVAPPSVQRLVALPPVRQPIGPPSNNDELIPKNFATRSRRRAIGALGALLDARERREIEAF